MPHAKSSIVLKVILAILVAVMISGTVYGTMLYASLQSDRTTTERQDSLIALVMGKMQNSIAHDQESSTVWDDAVRQVAAGNREWMAANLGQWMNTYFGHDAAFVLNPSNALVYGFAMGEENEVEAFASVSAQALPLVETLRRRQASADRDGVSDRQLSIGESDLTRINNRPAILSVKPIISDTGNIDIDKDHQYVHLAVRYLDGDFTTALASDYLFTDMRFQWDDDGDPARSVFALRSRSGQGLGYFSWIPFKPGTAVLQATRPALTAGAIVIFAALGALLVILQGRSRRLRESQGRLLYLAHHDALSGLPNRAAFNAALERTLLKTQAAVLFLDLDRFKNVNDTLGHPVGDKLITQVAARLSAAVGSDAVVARIGGDEFTIMIPGPTDRVETLASEIVATIRSPFEIDGQPILIGASIGIAYSTDACVDAQDLVRRADIALYHAKGAGRNQFAIFGPHMDRLIHTRQELERDLRNALETGAEITVHYQPIYTSDADLIGVEALARWVHPTKGMIQPDIFISIAEETGLIERLGEIVMKRALNDARTWSGLTVAINVSALELRSETYALRVIGCLSQMHFDPRRLEIEITESAVLDNESVCRANIQALRDIGIRVALDDFGKGFSSFGRLRNFEVDRIKIDRSFVEYGIPGGKDAIVHAMIELAHASGMRATAEGVETAEQHVWLVNAGCDELQGFLLSKPVPADEIERLHLQLRHLA